MIATISSWGNSQGLRVPKDILNELNLSVGDKVNIYTKKHQIIIEPTKTIRKKYDIKKLVTNMPKDYNAKEVFENSIGKEAW